MNRETLELAARAAGYEVACVADDVALLIFGKHVPWNPAEDRAQLMDLASDAGLVLDFQLGLVTFTRLAALNTVRLITHEFRFTPGDRASEAEAIINAAAEKGRRMAAQEQKHE